MPSNKTETNEQPQHLTGGNASKDCFKRKRKAREGHMKDALALGGEEGRDKLRKAACRGKYPLKRGYPNGATHLSNGKVSD